MIKFLEISEIIFKKINYFWLLWVLAELGLLVVAVHRLLISRASPVVEHGL